MLIWFIAHYDLVLCLIALIGGIIYVNVQYHRARALMTDAERQRDDKEACADLQIW
jgi:hypothetical protein